MAKKSKNEVQKTLDKSLKEKKDKSIKQAWLRGSGLYNAAHSMTRLFKGEDIDAKTLVGMLEDQLTGVIEGKTRRMETILMTQAQTLQGLFHFAMEKISHAEHLEQVNVYSDLAIKANNACRKSLLAITQIKNPVKTTFVRQQNNAVNQQINNDRPQIEEPATSKGFEKKPANELLSLGEIAHEKLDTGSKSQPSQDYSFVETVAESRR